MSDAPKLPPPPTDSAYIAHIWDYPQLTIAIFGLQVHVPEAYGIYVESGIPQQIEETLQSAEGLLCSRFYQEGTGGHFLQYWRTHEDLARFARQMPHTAWWKWLVQNSGQGFSFYHEIYQCKAAEAIFEVGCLPEGPATFCETSAVAPGEGRSQQRQQKFIDAAQRER